MLVLLISGVQICTDLIANQFKNSKIVLSEEMTLFNLLNQFKSSLFVLFSFRDNPIPISYSHFVKVMEAIYLPVLAYTFATIKDMYQLGVVHEVITASSLFIITLFFIGLISKPYIELFIKICRINEYHL